MLESSSGLILEAIRFGVELRFSIDGLESLRAVVDLVALFIMMLLNINHKNEYRIEQVMAT